MIPDSPELIKKLSNAHAVPGFEAEVREIIRKSLPESFNCTVDRMGNLTAHQPGNGPHIGIDCHMDEVGFMVQSITTDGFLKVVGLGGWSPATLQAQEVVVVTQSAKIPGVFASVPPHHKSGNSESPKVADLAIDIGAFSRSEVEAWGIRPGTAVCPATQAKSLNNPDLLMGKAFDNRVGCALLTETAKLNAVKGKSLHLMATAQEELGLRGADSLAKSLDLDLMIVLEGTPADDTPGINPPSPQAVPGKGVQIRAYDPTHLASPQFVDWVLELAAKNNISHQVAVRQSGGTNAGRFHLSPGGLPTLVLGVPVRYIHSHRSILSLKDYQSALSLIEAILSQMDDPTYAALLPV